jgi:hypothetical protein
MARIRTIKPDFWTNEKVLSVKALTRLLFIGMWNFADDYGRMHFSPLGIKAKIFPTDDLSVSDIKDMLHELCSADLITIYSANDQEYIEITGWDHQKIDRRQPSKIPGPFDDGSVTFVECSSSPADNSSSPAPVREGKGMEGKGNADAPASRPEASPEIDYFRRIKEICGSSGGGLGKKLLDAKNGNVPLARAAVEQASTKSDPREYIGAIIRGRGGGAEDLRARGEAW